MSFVQVSGSISLEIMSKINKLRKSHVLTRLLSKYAFLKD